MPGRVIMTENGDRVKRFQPQLDQSLSNRAHLWFHLVILLSDMNQFFTVNFLLTYCNSSRQVPPHGIASRSTEDLPQIFLELSRQLCPAIVPPGKEKLFLKLENNRKQKRPAASKDWEQKQVGLMLVQIQRVEAGQGFPLPRRGSQRPARFDRDPPALDNYQVVSINTSIFVCTLLYSPAVDSGHH